MSRHVGVVTPPGHGDPVTARRAIRANNERDSGRESRREGQTQQGARVHVEPRARFDSSGRACDSPGPERQRRAAQPHSSRRDRDLGVYIVRHRSLQKLLLPKRRRTGAPTEASRLARARPWVAGAPAGRGGRRRQRSVAPASGTGGASIAHFAENAHNCRQRWERSKPRWMI